MSVTTNKVQKNHTISLLRLVAMLFIVLCHFLQYYGNELAWWFNVGVQMFFCISGFLYAHKRIASPVSFVLRNFKKILIPYYCFLIPMIVLYFVFARDVFKVSDAVFSLLCSGTMDGIEHFWFISYILFCYLITPLLQDLTDKLRKTKWFVFLGAFALLTAIGQVLFISFDSFFSFPKLFCYLFGYFAAVFMQEYSTRVFRVLVGILSAATVLLNAVRIYCCYIAHIHFRFFDMFEQYAHSLLGIGIVLLSLVLIKNIRPNAVLNASDKYSFYVYIVHQLFILSPFGLLALTDFAALNGIIAILAVLLSAVLLKWIADRVTRGITAVSNVVTRNVCR